MIRALLTASVLAMSGTAAMADNQSDETSSMICVEAGTMAPDFAAVTAAGEAVDLASISGENGAVIVFSRSLDWCPYCKAQALELETVKADLEAVGWSLNLITYDAPETLAGFATDRGLTYTFLSDTDSAMIDAFGLRNTDVTAGSRFDGIPHPAIIYIKANGEVAGVQKEEGYKDRPATDGIPEFAALVSQGAPAAP
ncbi:MAG: peroxiredoxin family protein [Pseudomonadota bacterium]|jgi:peroxiredoxin Q/BCP|nr:peroxiredoxin family protein [Pseudomonadota bacterium]